MFLLEISTFRSDDLFIIDLQFKVAHCRLLLLPVVLSTSCIVFRFALLMLCGKFKLLVCC